ncbi:hypothetical protein ACEPAI_1565 [Sanghuangporus weigelae]
MGSNNSGHQHRDHKQSEHRKTTISGTDRHESAKSEDKRPKLVKLEKAKKEIHERADSIRKDHIIPLMTRVLIYVHQGDAIGQLGQALQDVAQKLMVMHDAEERVRQISNELKDRNNAEQNRSQDRHLPDPEFIRAENVRMDREDDWRSSVDKLYGVYEQAKKSVKTGHRTEYSNFTSKQDQENKEVLRFLENATYYAANKCDNLENIKKVLDIVNRASGALDELLDISDWPATQQLRADLDEHQANWRGRLAGNEGGVIEKGLLDEAKKEFANLQSRAEKIKAQVKEEENLKRKSAAKESLKTEMREIRKLSEPLKKEVKK